MPEVVEIKVTTAGAAGSATGNTTVSAVGKPFTGILAKVSVDYHASAPATTVVKLEEAGGLGSTIFTLAAGKTDKTVYPCANVTDATGAAISGAYIGYLTHADGFKVTVTLSDALTDCVVVKLLIV